LHKLFLRMRKILTLLLLLSGSSLFATIHNINQVGLSWSPNSLTTVLVGDTIRFSGNTAHTTSSVSVPAGANAWNHPFSTATTFDYVVQVAGTYNWRCNIHTTMTGSFVASNSTSREANKQIPVELFPMPAKQVLNIHTDLPNADIRMYNLTGQEVFNAQQVSFPFQISAPQSPGIYFVEIKSGKTRMTKKVIFE